MSECLYIDVGPICCSNLTAGMCVASSRDNFIDVYLSLENVRTVDISELVAFLSHLLYNHHLKLDYQCAFLTCTMH